MTDREKAIRGLEHCLKYFEADGFEDCADCPYNDGDVVGTCESMTPLVADALALLKEQESIVHCKDCKYATLTSDGKLVKYCGQLDEGDLYLDADFFCAGGVVRGDG